MIKLIATDLDGTLFNSKKEITENTIEILKEVIGIGIEICVATGRYIHEIKPLFDEIGIKSNYINLNGAELNSKEGNIIWSKNIADKDFIEIIKIFNKHGLIAEIYTDNGEYLIGLNWEECIDELYNRFKLEYGDHVDRDFVLKHKRLKTRKLINSPEELNRLTVGKRKIVTYSSDIEKLKKVKEELLIINGIVALSSAPHNIEITNIDAKKGIALEMLAKKLGISKNEVLIFGDGENDLSMFECFLNTVAMDNAVSCIKNRARYLTQSNNEEGVSNFIREYVFGAKI